MRISHEDKKILVKYLTSIKKQDEEGEYQDEMDFALYLYNLLDKVDTLNEFTDMVIDMTEDTPSREAFCLLVSKIDH